MKYFLITGDTHSRILERLNKIDSSYPPEETALIILGDAGINFHLNQKEEKLKEMICRTGYTLYLVRGNHEERPENLYMPSVYDEEVQGEVWREPQYPNINYFKDGGRYNLNGHSVLTIGGAYSVDKWYRLMNAPSWNTNRTGWFKDEQLTEDEMKTIEENCSGKLFDFVLTHTCPRSLEPTDLFIPTIDQHAVDKTMEDWFDKFKDMISYKHWLWGHYHADREISPKHRMFYYDIENLEKI